MTAVTPLTADPDVPKADAAADMAWPSERAGFYALFVIILATFLVLLRHDRLRTCWRSGSRPASSSATRRWASSSVRPTVLAYVFIGIPLARLVDIFPRKYVLSAGIAIIGSITALGGLAQTFGQFVATRLFVGAGGSAHGPGSYSMLADFFRPMRIPLVFALLQLGFILGPHARHLGRRPADRPDLDLARDVGCHGSHHLQLAVDPDHRRPAGAAGRRPVPAGEGAAAAQLARVRKAGARARLARPQDRRLHRPRRPARDQYARPRLLSPVRRTGAGGDREPGASMRGACPSSCGPMGWSEVADRQHAGADAAGRHAARHHPRRLLRHLARQAPQGRQYPRRRDHLLLHDDHVHRRAADADRRAGAGLHGHGR